MAEPPPWGDGRVRVTVVAGTRRADVAVPGGLRVAELLPELACGSGLLDAATVHRGYQLVTLDGRTLDGDEGLASQGVEDGAVLVIAADVDAAPPRHYDDVVEAMADVAMERARWDAAAGRRFAHGVALLLLVAGAGALLSQPGSGRAALAAVGTSLGLTAAAVGLSRVAGDTLVAIGLAWTACADAAVAGLLLPVDNSDIRTTVTAVGGGLLVTGLAAMLGPTVRRTLLLPPVLVGAVLVTTGVVSHAVPVEPAVVLTAGLALVVVAGGAVPWLALVVAGAQADVPVLEVTGLDLARLRGQARLAHDLAVALSVTVGLLLVVVAPVAVSLGPAGALVPVLSCAVVLLRCRRLVSADEVLVGLGSGVLGLLSVALSVLWLQPAWRPVVSVVLLATAPALLAARPVSQGTSARIGRAADLAEGSALAALLPTLVLASGAAAVAG